MVLLQGSLDAAHFILPPQLMRALLESCSRPWLLQRDASGLAWLLRVWGSEPGMQCTDLSLSCHVAAGPELPVCARACNEH